MGKSSEQSYIKMWSIILVLVSFFISPPEVQSALWHRRDQGEGCQGWELHCICGTSEHLVLALASELVLELFELFLVWVLESVLVWVLELFLVSVLELVLLWVLARVLVLMAEVLVACYNQQNCRGRHKPENM